jgi:hypothetical protein
MVHVLFKHNHVNAIKVGLVKIVNLKYVQQLDLDHVVDMDYVMNQLGFVHVMKIGLEVHVIFQDALLVRLLIVLGTVVVVVKNVTVS